MRRGVVPRCSARRRAPGTVLIAVCLASTLAMTACASSTAPPASAPATKDSPAPASTTEGSRRIGTLSGGAPPTTAPAVKQVIFIGDSITGGFGYEGDNYPILDTLLTASGCSQNPPPANACTNDQPGAGTTASGSTVTPWAAYPYQFRQLIASQTGGRVPVYDYAVSGATPAMWDPTAKASAANLDASGKPQTPGPGGCAAPNTKPQAMEHLDVNDPIYHGCDPNLYPGLFGTTNYPSALRSWNLTQLPSDSLTVMTLGANPLLSRMMYLSVLGQGVDGADNACAQKDTTTFLTCVRQDLTAFRQKQHLTNVLNYAAAKGPVLLELVYHTCPGTFGSSSSTISAYTSSNAACTGALQRQNAYAAIDLMNSVMREAVDDVKKANPSAQIAAVCPGNVTSNGVCGGPDTFDDHQATETQKAFNSQDFPATNPWVLSTDTGIHPTAGGHRFMAQGILSAACDNFNLWCQSARSENVTNYWTNMNDAKKCRSTYLCAFAAVKNNTDRTWTLATLSQSDVRAGQGDPIYAKSGEFVLYPPEIVRPGETARFMVQSRHTSATSWGAEGIATYRMSGGGRVTIDAEVGAIWNSWDLTATNRFSAKILPNSQKRGSDMILNGIVG